MATTDATGTRRRLQALITRGWSAPRLARLLGRDPRSLRRSMASATVTTVTAALVSNLYERLWDQRPPSRTPAERRETARAIAHAQAHRWLPPMAWDDPDRDPEPRPPRVRLVCTTDDDRDDVAIERAISGDRHVRLTTAELHQAVTQLTANGHSIQWISHHLNIGTRSVSRQRTAHSRIPISI